MKKTLLTLFLSITMSFSFSQQVINLTPTDNIQDTIDGLTFTQPVVINLASGMYNQSLHIEEGLQATASNTLTIQSSDANNMATIYVPNGNAIYIGTAYVTLKDLSLQSDTGTVLYLDGNNQTPVSFVNIESCNFIGSSLTDSYLIHFNGISAFNPSNDISITNCNFNSGKSGVEFESYYNYPVSNVNISNNVFTNQVKHPIYINSANNITISENMVNLPTNNSPFLSEQSIGIYLNTITTTNSQVSKISNNTIVNTSIDSVRYTGIKIANCYGNDSIYISNNYIDINNVDSLAYGIVCDYSMVNIYHNTVNVSGLRGRGIKVSGSIEAPSIRNNIFNTQDVAIEAQDIFALTDVDYNCYYAGDSLPFTDGYNRYTLDEWQVNNTNIDQNSVVENPNFVNGMNFTNTALDNSAQYIAEIEFDFDGLARNQPMCDMGAKELMFIDLGADIELCAGDTLTITSPTAYSYIWNTGDITQSIQIAQLGTYSVTVQESEFGPTASDSVNVIQAPNSVITGTVSYSGGAFNADDVNVELYVQHQENAFFIEQIASDYVTSSSTFMFTDVEPNNYALRGVVQNSNYNGVVTSYYGNTVDWENATYLNIGCGDTLDYNFTMYEITDLSGTCTFKGRITYSSSNKSTNLAGEPVTGAEIYIAQDPNIEPIANAVSDHQGNWEVEELEEGSGYNIKIDIPGLNLISTYTDLDIAPGDTLQNDFNFVVDTISGGGISVDTVTAILIVDNEEIELTIYPNPTTSFININTEVQNPTNIEFTISDITGKTVYTSEKEINFIGEYSNYANISEFENGVYILNLKIGNTFYIKKIIKE